MEIEYENDDQIFEDELDDNWIKLIEEEEKEYTHFYRECNDVIKIFFYICKFIKQNLLHKKRYCTLK